jgi:ferrous iron transport protein A
MGKNGLKTFVVVGFSEDCPRSYQHKLMAMGFTVGSMFKFIRLAPFGDPWQIEIKGVMISLRKSELAWILFKESDPI